MASATEDHPAAPADDAAPSRTGPTTHAAFDSPDADVVLVSRDLVSFRTHSFILKTTSGWFRSLFSLPKPSSSNKPALAPSTADPETIHLEEDGSTLELLLRMVSGLPIQPLLSFDTIDAILFAAEKYDMPGPISLVRIAVLTPPLAEQPLRLYGSATRYGWTEEAQVASQRTLTMNLWQDEHWETLSKVDGHAALALLKFHRARRDGLRGKLDEHPFVNASPTTYCSRCRQPADHRAWRELKHRITMEMDVRPLGDTVLEVGLTEWPEAKTCWESKCPNAECGLLQYDKVETMRLIRERIDSLPKMA